MLSAASCGGQVTQPAPRTRGGRVAWLSPYETVVDGSGCDAGAAHPHTHPYPPSLVQIDARAGRARSGFGQARIGQRRRSPQACTGRQRCEGRRCRATLRRLGAQGMFMRTAAMRARCHCPCSPHPGGARAALVKLRGTGPAFSSRLHRAAFRKSCSLVIPLPPRSQSYARLTKSGSRTNHSSSAAHSEAGLL